MCLKFKYVKDTFPDKSNCTIPAFSLKSKYVSAVFAERSISEMESPAARSSVRAGLLIAYVQDIDGRVSADVEPGQGRIAADIDSLQAVR